MSMKGLLALFLCAFVFASCDRFEEDLEQIKDEVKEREMKMFEAYLGPLNNSGVTGKATIKYSEDGMFQVWIEAKGLFPDRFHPQHIHGFVPDGPMKNKNGVCPPPSADTNGNGLVELEEGEPFYGQILVPLDDELVPLTAGQFPFVDFSRSYTYYETVATKALIAAFDNMYNGTQTEKDLMLMNRVIVLHGAFVKDGKIIQNYSQGGEYWPTLPVACGQIEKKVF